MSAEKMSDKEYFYYLLEGKLSDEDSEAFRILGKFERPNEVPRLKMLATLVMHPRAFKNMYNENANCWQNKYSKEMENGVEVFPQIVVGALGISSDCSNYQKKIGIITALRSVASYLMDKSGFSEIDETDI